MNTLINIEKFIEENKWHNARIEWINFNKMKFEKEGNLIKYDFFLNEFDDLSKLCVRKYMLKY